MLPPAAPDAPAAGQGAPVDPNAPPGPSSPPPSGPTPFVAAKASGPTPEELAAGAATLAGGVVLLCTAGIAAAMELLPAGGPFDELVRDPKSHQVLLAYVAGAAQRVALKYNLTATLPYEDELVVALACGLSVVAMARQAKAGGTQVAGEGDHERAARAKPAGAPPPTPEEHTRAAADDWRAWGVP